MNPMLPGFIDSLSERKKFRARVPMSVCAHERYGKYEEIAARIAFLASDGAEYITWQNIRLDGGITRSVLRVKAGADWHHLEDLRRLNDEFRQQKSAAFVHRLLPIQWA